MKSVVRLFYGFQFFFSLLLWLPIFYEYQKRIGLDDQQIFTIQSLYYVVFCFLEIPTGMFADYFGTRRCLRFGAAVLVLTNLLPIYFQTYEGFLWHFILIALARSLISGASSAYIYDYLQQNDAGDFYKEIEGKARAYGLFGKVVCWAAIGPLMEWHFTLPYSLTALSAFIAWGISLYLPDVRVALKAARDSWVTRIKDLSKAFRRVPILPFLMVQGVAIFVLSRICQVNLFQPILQDKSYGVTAFGLVMSLMTIFEGIGSLKPIWFRKLMTDFNAVYFLTVVMAVTLGITAISGPIGTLICLSVFSLATGLSYPIQRQLVNSAVPESKYRATVLSIESIVDRAANAGAAALIGGFLSTGRLHEFLIICGVISTCGVILLISLSYAFGFYSKAE